MSGIAETTTARTHGRGERQRVLTPGILTLAAVVVLGAIMTILDATIVNVAIAAALVASDPDRTRPALCARVRHDLLGGPRGDGSRARTGAASSGRTGRSSGR
jgi:hypothetical protein